MTTTINASTSAGLVQTADTSGSLALQTANTTAVTINTSQNVGIGTTSPAQKLHVYSSSPTIFAEGTGTSDSGVQTKTSLANFKFGAGIGSATNCWNVYDLAAGTERMRIDSSGNVGIGTTSPSYQLQVNKNQNAETGFAVYNTNNSASASVGFYQKVYNASGYLNGQETQYLTYGGAYSGTPLSSGPSGAQAIIATGGYGAPIVFGRGGTFSGMWDSSGNLLVGTTSAGSGATSALLRVSKTSGNGIYSEAATTSSGYRYISNALSDGGTYYHINFLDNGTSHGSITSNGTNVAYNTSSDYRLKENVQLLTGALSLVSRLKPSKFTWKETGAEDSGFIAHELQEVCPSAVTGEKDAVNEDGSIKPQQIDTSFLVATLTAAIQELKAINDTQAETINALTARIVALEGK